MRKAVPLSKSRWWYKTTSEKVHFIGNVDWNITILEKKIGACVFWAPYFLLSLLAGKFATFEQMLQIKHFFKNDVCVLQAPVFFF